MRLQRRHNLLRLRVLTNHLRDHRVLHKRCVCCDVRVMVLVNKLTHGLANKCVHILTNRIFRFEIFFRWDEFVCVLYPKNLDHLPV